MKIPNKIHLFIVLLFIGLLCVNVPIIKAVRLTAVKIQKPVLYFTMDENRQEEFVICFTHSVNRRPVYDYIRVEQDGFMVVKSRYDAFGAGMPEYSMDTDMRLTWAPDGWLELININRRLDTFTLFTGAVIANHTLTVRDKVITLSDIVTPGEPVEFKVAKISLLELLNAKLKGGYVE